MKKKSLLLCLSLMMGTFLLSTIDVMAASKAYDETNIRRIPLEGEFETLPMRSIITPITVEQQGDMLFVHFQGSVGVVQITITDEWGSCVFTEIVDSDIPMLTISLMGLPPDSYVITFSGISGELNGKFEIF